MKILHTCDIHNNIKWWKWIKKEAPKYDAVTIGGDYLDLVRSNIPAEIQIQTWKKELESWPKDHPHLFLATGNHDIADSPAKEFEFFNGLKIKQKEQAVTLFGEDGWIQTIPVTHNIHPPNDTRTLKRDGEKLVTITPTCYPHESIHTQKKSEEGWITGLLEYTNQKTKVGEENIMWIVVSHVPPAQELQELCDIEYEWSKSAITTYKPTIQLAGHMHTIPYVINSAIEYEETTAIVNPGRTIGLTKKEIAPNHIIINTENKELTWNYYDKFNKEYLSKTTYLK